MVAVILVLKLAINTFTRLMSIQIDEDSGMTQSRISSAVATNNSSLRFDDRFFCNQINGPTWISLLFFDHESSRPHIIFIPLLSCMSYLIFDCQSLNYPNSDSKKATKKMLQFLFTFDEWIDDRHTDLDRLVIAVFLIIVAAILTDFSSRKFRIKVFRQNCEVFFCYFWGWCSIESKTIQKF